MWNSSYFIAQKKLNGIRAIIHFVRDVGIFITTRTISVKTWRYEELSNKFVFFPFVPSFSAVLDSEIMIDQSVDTRGYTSKGEVTKSSLHSTVAVLHILAPAAIELQEAQGAFLHIHVFDCLSYRGIDVTSKPLEKRLRRLAAVEKMIQAEPQIAPHFSFLPVTHNKKLDYFRQVVSDGGEGVILKNLTSPYVASSSRLRDGWIKVKKEMEFDAFVTGCIQGKKGTAWENYIGAIEFSVLLSDQNERRHVIGYASNLTLKERALATVQTENGPALNPDYLGRVAEISGQDLSARQLRLTHCRINRWRKGKDAKHHEDCMAQLSDLKRKAAWVQ